MSYPPGPQHRKAWKARGMALARGDKEGRRAPGDRHRCLPAAGSLREVRPMHLRQDGLSKALTESREQGRTGCCGEGRSPRRCSHELCGAVWVCAPFHRGPLHSQMPPSPWVLSSQHPGPDQGPQRSALTTGIGQEGEEEAGNTPHPKDPIPSALGSSGE